MDNNKQPVIMGTFKFKSKTMEGYPAKYYVSITSEDVVLIRVRLISLNKTTLKLIRIYKGFYVYDRDYSIKMSSLVSISNCLLAMKEHMKNMPQPVTDEIPRYDH